MVNINKFKKTLPVFFTLISAVLASSLQPVFSQAERRLIREGNRLYQKEQFDESELSYRRALEKDEDSPYARFNLGNALYKQERYDEAMRFFGELAEEVDDSQNRSKVFHNLGNSMLMNQQVKESIEAYKEALRNNPDDMETRYNLALAQHLLDEMENQQQRNGDSQEGDDQDREGDAPDHNNDKMQDEDDHQHTDPEQQDNGMDDQEQAPRQLPDQISPEDALRMLEAADREDQRVQEKLMEENASDRQPATGRNW